MRTRPAHIEPGCPWCNADHNPDIPCRLEPESIRFQLGEEPPAPVHERQRIARQRITDASGNLIAVQVILREG